MIVALGIHDLPMRILEADLQQCHARDFTLTHKTMMLVYQHPLAIMPKSFPVHRPLLHPYSAAAFDGINEYFFDGYHE
jgi:hypothetical protein